MDDTAVKEPVLYGPSLLTEHDIYLFREGTHYRLYEKLGSHPMKVEGEEGTLFAVWAPNAESVAVTGDFNNWSKNSHFLAPRHDGSGIWEGFLPGVGSGVLYKYYITSKDRGYRAEKTDPFACSREAPPSTASVVTRLEHAWNDEEWMQTRHQRNGLDQPFSIYEMHLGSWRRVPEEGNRFMTYLELATWLPSYLKEMNFTHVQFLPVMEHPFFGSWGYQTTGYYSPTARFGPPEDFMALIDALHQYGIGVILDWVPSHFPTDEHGLIYFDGTHLFSHEDPRQGYHPDWNSAIFNYGRNEVRGFLISSAIFWLDRYHADGLRVDAVASMLYLDYSREEGDWIPNRYGGRENLEAISFLREFNSAVYDSFPDVQTIAEESTAWPMVSRPTYVGGLGFGMKWNMGWMHDALQYFSLDPIFRQYNQNQLTFSIWYAFSENFVLPLSHDEVVYGKGSLFGKMPGDNWQKYANLRLLYTYMWAHPGKKLLFMGGEIAQWSEWAHEGSLEWNSLEFADHQGVKRLVEDLNRTYRNEPALHGLDFSDKGFQWVDFHDNRNSVISFLRKSSDGEEILVVLNFTPVPRSNYRIGVPRPGIWKEMFNSDASLYSGAGWGNMGGVASTPIPSHGYYDSISLTLPPLGGIYLKLQDEE
ncbi:MAG: 1,4-alpha-glucan branching protein GlgB [Desulfovibrionales bacterium]